jgi:hypothetical protein
MAWLWVDQQQTLQWGGLLTNTLVHVLMYWYYYVTTVGNNPWWKKYITSMQIVQFSVRCGTEIVRSETPTDRTHQPGLTGCSAAEGPKRTNYLSQNSLSRHCIRCSFAMPARGSQFAIVLGILTALLRTQLHSTFQELQIFLPGKPTSYVLASNLSPTLSIVLTARMSTQRRRHQAAASCSD